MTGIFKANQPVNGFLLLIYGLLVRFALFLDPTLPRAGQADGYFYHYLLQALEPIGTHFPLIYSLLAYALVYIQAMSLNAWVNKQKLMPRPHYLTAMSYLLISALFTEWQQLSAQLVMATVLIWVLQQLGQLYNHPNARGLVFNAGFALGLGTLFYTPGLAFLLLLMAGLAITRPLRLPEWIMGLIGLLTPAYLYAAWLFLTDRWRGFQLPVVKPALQDFHFTIWVYIALALILLAAVVGSVFVQNSIGRLLVQSRKCWGILYIYLLVAIGVPLVAGFSEIGNWLLTLLPLAAIIGASFYYPERRWYGHLVHWGLLALAVVNSYFIR